MESENTGTESAAKFQNGEKLKCPNDSTHSLTVRILAGSPAFFCDHHCDKLKLRKHFLNGSANGARETAKPKIDDRPIEGSAGESANESKPLDQPNHRKNGKQNTLPARAISQPQQIRSDDILKRVPPQNLEAEQSVLGAILLENSSIEEANRILKAEDFYRETHREIFKAMRTLWQSKAPIDAITLTHALRTKGALEFVGGAAYIAELASIVPTSVNIASYAQIVRNMAIKREFASRATNIASLAYDGVSADALIGEASRLLNPMIDAGTAIREPIPWEGFDAAVSANDEYLKRLPVIDRLCYSNAVSMITGGKHAGKSTLARWMAVCVAKGWEFLKRETRQGPVFYIASEDETMAARQELIRLGWKQGDDLRFLSAQNIRSDKPDIFLADLTMEIKRAGARLVILDMLFDFVRIEDEMSYAGTREAVGRIQEVASASGAHIVAIHHAPKNANIGDAAVAALGSQGLAARVSPIILVRRFGPGVHSISSTSVRDPRGEPINESKLVKNEDGSVELGGGWKNYMLAEVYSERVKEMLDEDPGAEMSPPEISEALAISYPVARGCLAALYRNGLITRTGSGKKGKPYRYASLLSESNSTLEAQERERPSESPEQRPFAYKD